jgi:thiol:disulfide interchange protein
MNKPQVLRLFLVGVVCASALVSSLGLTVLLGPTVEAWAAAYQPIPWEPFSLARFEEACTTRTPILLNFTAAWDVSIPMPERTVLDRARVRRLIRARGLLPLRVDCTNPNLENDVLLEFVAGKEHAIPTVVIYPANRSMDPIVLGDAITEQAVVEAIRQGTGG